MAAIGASRPASNTSPVTDPEAANQPESKDAEAKRLLETMIGELMKKFAASIGGGG